MPDATFPHNGDEAELVLKIGTNEKNQVVYEYTKAGISVSPPFISMDAAKAWLIDYRIKTRPLCKP